MDPLLISAASGMKARMESLDLLANNIANSGTTGFKADREFYNLIQDQLPLVERNWTDFSQGTLLPTGNQLDLALSGAGFFALNTPSGVVYTRNGQFQVGATNQLQSTDGYTLRNVRDNGRPIVVDPRVPIAIDRVGVVEQGGQILGQLEIAGHPAAGAEGITKLGNSYFRMAPVSGAAGASPPPAAATTEVLQGTVEQSNVSPGDAAVRLVGVMRQFEMLQKAVSIGTDMNKQALTEIARVS
jgi:flagellar basal-body rod protein FlgF